MAIPPNFPTMILIRKYSLSEEDRRDLDEFIANPHLNPKGMITRDPEIEAAIKREPTIVLVISHEAPAYLLVELLAHGPGSWKEVTLRPFTDTRAYKLRYPER